MNKNGKATDIQIGYPFTVYSIEELKEKFKNVLNSEFTKETNSSFEEKREEDNVFCDYVCATTIRGHEIFLHCYQ